MGADSAGNLTVWSHCLVSVERCVGVGFVVEVVGEADTFRYKGAGLLEIPPLALKFKFVRKLFIYSDFDDLSGDFCQVLSVTMPASLPLQLAKLILKYPSKSFALKFKQFLKVCLLLKIKT